MGSRMAYVYNWLEPVSLYFDIALFVDEVSKSSLIEPLASDFVQRGLFVLSRLMNDSVD